MSVPLFKEQVRGGVVLTINRPDKRNALSAELVELLFEAIDTAHADHTEVIIFRGTGKNLRVGFDFSLWQESSKGDLILRFIRIETLLQKIATSPAVTFALAHGRNFGAGANFFGACKRRIAEPDATFQMPGLNFGLVLGTQRFSACVGRDIAREILSSTRTFDAQEDQVISFITEIAPTETWDTLVETELAQTPAPSRALLHGAIDNDQSDRDLAQLVRSATTPGLKSRIATYLAQAN